MIEIKDETVVGTDTAAEIEVSDGMMKEVSIVWTTETKTDDLTTRENIVDITMMIVNIPICEEGSVTEVMIKMVDKPTGLLRVILLTNAVGHRIVFSLQMTPRRLVRFSPL
jgi:hypothetical protein